MYPFRCSRAIAAVWVAAIVGGCVPDIPTAVSELPDVEGEWTYTATAMQPSGSTSDATCRIEGMTIKLGPWSRSGFYGRTSGGELICSHELQPLGGVLPSYAVRRGGSVPPTIAFDLGSSDWRHEGTYTNDEITGRFGLQQGLIEFDGNFHAIRISPGESESPGANANRELDGVKVAQAFR